MENISLITIRYFIFLFFLSAFTHCSEREQADNTYEADVIVYGGTSAAVTAAVQAKKMGKSVVMVAPDVHLGGLSSGGLGYTDTGNKEVIGGLAREFYHRLYLHYQNPEAWKWQEKSEYGNKGQGTAAIDGDARTMWIFEPHAAEKVFEDFVAEHEIEVYRDEWLNRESGVTMKEGRIVSIETLSGKTFKGKMFIDATYEGDLMAAAKVSYHVGRESNSVYNEQWNGVQKGTEAGGYDSTQYELLLRLYDKGWRETFQKFDAIPNRKTDTNNHGPFGTDNIGMNYDYPEASYERRQEIIEEHEIYQKGLMYFIAHDPRIPAEVQEEMNQWGLAKDEFTDNGNWPHQIYVREARRMIGEYVMTENEVLGKMPVPRPVGMGSYTLDSHHTQRYVTPEGYVQNEGIVGVKTSKPYSISYGSLIPKEAECENLLVPVCVSSSHIAFGSIRMEPVFMILGQSAAAAAAIAIDDDISVQQVDYEKLKAQLLRDKQHLTLNE